MNDIAITFDIEHDDTIQHVIPEIIDILNRYDAVGTWFVKHDYTGEFTDYTGRVLWEYPRIIANLDEVGEIGTHVHFRDIEGTFSMDPSLQRELIEDATKSFRDQGYDVTSFRSGNLCVDEKTLQILEDFDYQADSSVLPWHRRALPDEVVVNHENVRGHKPYTPSSISHTEPGDLNILEIPVSSLSPLKRLPIRRSLTGFYNKLADTPGLNRLVVPLYRLWSAITGAPIVLLYHDHEFAIGDGSLDAFERFVRSVSNNSTTRIVTIDDIRTEHQVN